MPISLTEKADALASALDKLMQTAGNPKLPLVRLQMNALIEQAERELPDEPFIASLEPYRGSPEAADAYVIACMIRELSREREE